MDFIKNKQCEALTLALVIHTGLCPKSSPPAFVGDEMMDELGWAFCRTENPSRTAALQPQSTVLFGRVKSRQDKIPCALR